MECKECGYEEDIIISFNHEIDSRVSELTMICMECDPDAKSKYGYESESKITGEDVEWQIELCKKVERGEITTGELFRELDARRRKK